MINPLLIEIGIFSGIGIGIVQIYLMMKRKPKPKSGKQPDKLQ